MTSRMPWNNASIICHCADAEGMKPPNFSSGYIGQSLISRYFNSNPPFPDDDPLCPSLESRFLVAITPHAQIMPIPPIYVDIVPLHVGWVHDSRQHMQNVRHRNPAFAIFHPNQLRTIPESRCVLRARLPVVASVFLKNVPVLPQLFICSWWQTLKHNTRHAPKLQYALSRTILPCIQRACPIPSWTSTLGKCQYNFLLPFPAFFAWKLHKIRVATMRLMSPSTASLRLPPLVCSDHSDTFHYTIDTLQVPFSLLSAWYNFTTDVCCTECLL